MDFNTKRDPLHVLDKFYTSTAAVELSETKYYYGASRYETALLGAPDTESNEFIMFLASFKVLRCMFRTVLANGDTGERMPQLEDRFPEMFRTRGVGFIVHMFEKDQRDKFFNLEFNKGTIVQDMVTLGEFAALALPHGGYAIKSRCLCDMFLQHLIQNFSSPSLGSLLLRAYDAPTNRTRQGRRQDAIATVPRRLALDRLHRIWDHFQIPLSFDVWSEALGPYVQNPFLPGFSLDEAVDLTTPEGQKMREAAIDNVVSVLAMRYAQRMQSEAIHHAFAQTLEHYVATSLDEPKTPGTITTTASGTTAGLYMLVHYLAASPRALNVLVESDTYYLIKDLLTYIAQHGIRHNIVNTRDPAVIMEGTWDVVMMDAQDFVVDSYRTFYNVVDFAQEPRFQTHHKETVFVVDMTALTLAHPYFRDSIWPAMRDKNVIFHMSMHKKHMLGTDRVNAGLTVTFHNHHNSPFEESCRAFATDIHPNERLDVYTESVLHFCLRDTKFFDHYLHMSDVCTLSFCRRMLQEMPEFCVPNLDRVLAKGVPLPYILVVNPDPPKKEEMGSPIRYDPDHVVTGPLEPNTFDEVMTQHFYPHIARRPSFGFRTPFMANMGDDMFRISVGMDLDQANEVFQRLRDAYWVYGYSRKPKGGVCVIS